MIDIATNDAMSVVDFVVAKLTSMLKAACKYQASTNRVMVIEAFLNTSITVKMFNYSRNMYMARYSFISLDYFIRFLLMKRMRTMSVQEFERKVTAMAFECVLFLTIRWLITQNPRIEGVDYKYEELINYFINSGVPVFSEKVISIGDLKMAVQSIKLFRTLWESDQIPLIMLGFDPYLATEGCLIGTPDENEKVPYDSIKASNDRLYIEIDTNKVVQSLNLSADTNVNQNVQNPSNQRQQYGQQNQRGGYNNNRGRGGQNPNYNSNANRRSFIRNTNI